MVWCQPFAEWMVHPTVKHHPRATPRFAVKTSPEYRRWSRRLAQHAPHISRVTPSLDPTYAWWACDVPMGHEAEWGDHLVETCALPLHIFVPDLPGYVLIGCPPAMSPDVPRVIQKLLHTQPLRLTPHDLMLLAPPLSPKDLH
ncbi:hypothetical protein SAMN00768000_3748 [Sulfobacillus thermosulfidooxidans DSM 9293]|uniref:Uncharacterized protein n=1 Tax=Sulfobacillus thermosulfidooxidans (strain DSM 9293 / VKM B-1269 / AT-1) TaxID=929705 RepID=A0A1W1WPH1_SULTA|nr:hypothetical protein [Sulfobacillus thermosulfidooxidans]SMC08208.1 hypothetical protein SAMN00768000_3748 [Sulfobacillus thermosulfidooxidans DSM 9293]